jgi:uncharacterized membrane protein YhaH (DUF805 family)
MDLILSPFLKYADFSGRARRLEYWGFAFTQIVIYVVFFMVTGISLVGMPHDHPGAAIAGLLGSMGVFGLIILALFIPNLSVTVRRLHDTGHSARWLGLMLPGVLYNIMNFSSIAGAIADGSWPQPSAAFMLLLFAAAACNLYMLWLMARPGDRGGNRFGPDPKTGQSDPSTPAVDADAAKMATRPAFDASPTPSASAQAAARAMDRAVAEHQSHMTSCQSFSGDAVTQKASGPAHAFGGVQTGAATHFGKRNTF